MHLMKVDPRALKDNPDRTRQTKASPRADALLLATIKAVGIIQPPVVFPETGGGNGYIIDAGHRRVRQAIAAAIDRKAVIEGAADGFGTPIGSYYTPGAPGYIDLTGTNAYDVARARALLHQAGVALPLELTMKLPPTPYARQGGEVIAAMLDKVGIRAKIENVEWAQWLSGVYKDKAYDLTVIAHVEPLDFGNFARPGYYWNYESPQFNELWAKIQATARADERNQLMGDAQRLVADDAVAAYLYQPTWITVANARLKGLWKDVPLFANDLSALSWQ